jgi:GNAT superfamily N-acetyltransferase
MRESEMPSSVALEAPRDALPSEAEAIRLFLVANGWSHRVGTPERFATLLRASSRTAVVRSDSRVVGFARAITDGLSNGYLSMVAVTPQCRRRGVGSALVAHVTAGPPEVTWVLQAGSAWCDRVPRKTWLRSSAACNATCAQAKCHLTLPMERTSSGRLRLLAAAAHVKR